MRFWASKFLSLYLSFFVCKVKTVPTLWMVVRINGIVPVTHLSQCPPYQKPSVETSYQHCFKADEC